MDVADDAATEAALEWGFSEFLTKRASRTKRVLRAALPFARQDASGPDREPAGAIILDEIALFRGLMADGLKEEEPKTSSLWLVGWLRDHGVEPEAMVADSFRSVRLPLSPRTQVLPSDRLRDIVFPLAQRFGEALRGSRDFHLRDLTFALFLGLTENRSTPQLTTELLRQLRADFLRRVRELYPRERNRWLDLSEVEFPPDVELPQETETATDAAPAGAGNPQMAEYANLVHDAPAVVDLLGREAFADVLATQIKRVSAKRPHKRVTAVDFLKNLIAARVQYLREFFGDDDEDVASDSTFILHLDGPWGSGKTSILNFLKANLKSSRPKWLVVEFNAWQNQRRKPAWWPLIAAVGREIRRQSWSSSFRARWVWASWNLRMRWAPALLSLILIGAFITFAWGAVSQSPPSGAATQASPAQAYAELLGKVWQGLLAVFALGGLVWTGSRTLFFGSKTAAEAFVQSSTEPFHRIIKLFDRMIRALDRPVAVFIDDIDRCDSDYVIEFLEGIQTLLRTAPVVYVVAGDHKWICSSFEKRYIDFCPTIGAPGRPLGHLFLHKVFQLTISIPILTGVRQRQFWGDLLVMEKKGGESEKQHLKQLEKEAEEKLKGAVRYEDIQQQIEGAKNSVELETLRAAAAKQMTSPEATEEVEHRLHKFHPLLEANPRAMKLTVNAWVLNLVCAILEGRKVDVDALGRWTMVQLRWPVLAAYLAENWSDIAEGGLVPNTFPDHIRALLTDIDVRKVFEGGPKEGRLNRRNLHEIIGSLDDSEAAEEQPLVA